MKHLTRLVVAFTVALMASPLTPNASVAQEGSAPWPTDGWATSTPEEQGMDSERLVKGVDYLMEQVRFDIHSLTVIRNGNIVTDAYFHPFVEDELHALASVTKSFISTLVGIAIDKGHIEAVDQPVLDLFPDRSVANVDVDKEAMTIADLLTMSSGLECTEGSSFITTMQMVGSPDWVQFALDLPMADPPGTRWVYCNPGSHLLSALVTETTGMSTEEFASEHLFGPLGITDMVWSTDPQGYSLGYADLIMGPHDLAKLGYLYLHGGEWDGQQLLGSDWVTAATTPGVSAEYGYQWWLGPAWFYADGWGGQRMSIFPGMDLIVVTTGGGGSDPSGVLATLLNKYVLPAVDSDASLPADSDGQAWLESAVREAAAPVDTDVTPVPPLPDTAQRVSGRTYLFEPNPDQMQAATLIFEERAEATLEILLADGSELEWVIGLDNLPRMGTGRSGMPAAATGTWVSDDVFVIQLDQIGGIGKGEIRVTFEDDQVAIVGHGLELVGRLEESVAGWDTVAGQPACELGKDNTAASSSPVRV